MVKYTPELVKEIGNAIAAYGVILRYASLGMDVPVQFEKFKDFSEENLPTKVLVQLLKSDIQLPEKDRIVKETTKGSMFDALDFGFVWLERALKA